MEVLLLSFCFISLALSSIFVGFELIRDQRKQKQSTPQKAELQKNVLMDSAPSSLTRLGEAGSLKSSQKAIEPNSMGRGQVTAPPAFRHSVSRKTKILAALNKQLKTLGYVSPNQQLGFVNSVLNSERTTIEEINANDVRQLFKVIRRYTNSQSSTHSLQLSQNNIRHATAS